MKPQKTSLIESDAFPFEFLSVLGERESWRKEVHRPVYHIHKWWAKRLGSVFRGILLGSILPNDADLADQFYQVHALPKSVFDPFMGSGTTIGEGHKLGLAALGRDINPVAVESVRVSLGPMDGQKIQEAFSRLSDGVGAPSAKSTVPRIRVVARAMFSISSGSCRFHVLVVIALSICFHHGLSRKRIPRTETRSADVVPVLRRYISWYARAKGGDLPFMQP